MEILKGILTSPCLVSYYFNTSKSSSVKWLLKATLHHFSSLAPLEATNATALSQKMPVLMTMWQIVKIVNNISTCSDEYLRNIKTVINKFVLALHVNLLSSLAFTNSNEGAAWKGQPIRNIRAHLALYIESKNRHIITCIHHIFGSKSLWIASSKSICYRKYLNIQSGKYKSVEISSVSNNFGFKNNMIAPKSTTCLATVQRQTFVHVVSQLHWQYICTVLPTVLQYS